MISETKLDESFSKGQYLLTKRLLIDFIESYRLDQNSEGPGIMLFIRECIPFKLLFIEKNPVEAFYVETSGCFGVLITLIKIKLKLIWRKHLKTVIRI